VIIRVLLLAFVFITLSAFGQAVLFESVQKDGSLAFSDTSTADSQPYTVTGANVSNFSSTAPGASTTTTMTTEPLSALGEASVYSAVSIIQPMDQTTIHNQTPIQVSVITQPALKTGDKVQLLLDGVPMGVAQNTLQFTLTDLQRGTHQVQARVVGADGTTLKMGLPITLFKQQPSVLLPVGPPAAP
jgi:hypothetical protein